MIVSTDFSPISIQASAWASEPLLRPGALLGYALQQWADVYDGEPVALPHQAQLPADFPTATVQSRDTVHQIGLAVSRVNVVWQRPPGGQPVDLAQTLRVFVDRVIGLLRHADQPVGRLAVVVHRLAAKDDPGIELARHFCRPDLLVGPLNRPEGFELHAHKVYRLGGFDVNSWMRAKTAQEPPGRYNRVFVEQDINTLEEARPDAAFSDEQIQDFYARVGEELGGILDLYFPARAAAERAV